MDQLFVNLIGKPKLNPSGRIITLIAENFCMLEDQAKFLKATFAIPTEKQLPLNDVRRQLIQVGPLHSDIRGQLEKEAWTIVRCDSLLAEDDGQSLFHEKLDQQASHANSRSLIFINDASRIQLALGDKLKWKKFLRLLHKWRISDKHFVVVLYQQSRPICSDSSSYLRDLEYISDGCLTTKSFRSCYLQSMWFPSIDKLIKTLIPPKVETQYYTCKIGKSYWSTDLLCFYERHKVTKGYDPDLDDNIKNAVMSSEKAGETQVDPNRPEENALERALHKVGLDDEEEDDANLNPVTLPYIKAQNPEQSRIFYYPDKDDDVDEDDPDDDLGI